MNVSSDKTISNIVASIHQAESLKALPSAFMKLDYKKKRLVSMHSLKKSILSYETQ